MKRQKYLRRLRKSYQEIRFWERCILWWKRLC